MKPSSVPKWVVTIANIVLFLEVFLSALYIYPEFARPFIPLPIFLALKNAFLLIICIGFAFFIPAVILSSMRQVYKIILIVVTPMLVCVSAGGVFDRKSGISSIEHLWNSVQVGNSQYNLVQIIPVGDPHSPCYLYKCRINGLGCEEISSYIGNCWSRENSDLVVNLITNEVNVFIDDEWSNGLSLDFTYGDQPRSYLHKLEVASFDYYLAYFHDYDTFHTPFRLLLYRCEKNSVNCSRLPFQYDTQRLPATYLEFDEIKSEIKIFVDNELVYTYGDPPKCYVEGCSLTVK